MRSILSFVAVVSGIVFMHASKLKLPEGQVAGNEAAAEMNIPGSTSRLPVPGAAESLVYMPDSLFQAYQGDHNFLVTNHYHVLYIKTDSVQQANLRPLVPHRVFATSLMYR
ncbi:hypothetical protein ACFOTA_10935 [Chitinophaga sp. GCM10012297]|uniref:Uncharacterized protein n=1 Tax=Chitinophaga chungangae TaxID=2821488 RepID=A0ABS3YF31_9BACT|nr:hypothetical protein [Chitinophaga chungangae]MBO9152724.1 hypothetical protein [Chitinophaga chungangae]